MLRASSSNGFNRQINRGRVLFKKKRKTITSPKAKHSRSLLTEAGTQSSANVTNQISYEKSQEDDWSKRRGLR